MVKSATVLIPTCGRPYLIKHMFNGLQAQNCKDFEVLLVLRPNDTETIKVVEHYKKYLDVRILYQKHRGLMEAYNEGIHNVHSDVIIFLDDDAIPKPDFITEHLLTYERINVSGVSGEVIPAHLANGILKSLEGSSEVTEFYREPEILRIFGCKLWNRPLEGQERYLAYISKAGYSRKNIYIDHHKITESLLCMGANMSILSSALKNFKIPASFLKRGIAFEITIGWHLWKTGHRMVFNPRAQVYHILHGQTMSRALNTKTISQAVIEGELLFYYLINREEKLSKMHRIASLIYNSLVHIKKIEENWRYEMAILKGILLGNMIGLKWLVSRSTKGTYVPIQDAILK